MEEFKNYRIREPIYENIAVYTDEENKQFEEQQRQKRLRRKKTAYDYITSQHIIPAFKKEFELMIVKRNLKHCKLIKYLYNIDIKTKFDYDKNFNELSDYIDKHKIEFKQLVKSILLYNEYLTFFNNGIEPFNDIKFNEFDFKNKLEKIIGYKIEL